jgi:hypothetical protein
LFIRIGETLPGSSVVLWRRYARQGRGERVALRVSALHTDDGPWLPDGLTSRHVTPDVAGQAARDLLCLGDVALTFSNSPRCFRAAASSLAALPQRREAPLPSLRHLLNVRPPRPDVDVAMFLLPMAGVSPTADRVWRTTQESVAWSQMGNEEVVLAPGGVEVFEGQGQLW